MKKLIHNKLIHNYGHLIWVVKMLIRMIDRDEVDEEILEEARFIVITEENKLLPPSKQPRD